MQYLQWTRLELLLSHVMYLFLFLFKDVQFPASNLSKGKKWLCAKSNKEPSIEVEFRFPKAVVISFIDIGKNTIPF